MVTRHALLRCLPLWTTHTPCPDNYGLGCCHPISRQALRSAHYASTAPTAGMVDRAVNSLKPPSTAVTARCNFGRCHVVHLSRSSLVRTAVLTPKVTVSRFVSFPAESVQRRLRVTSNITGSGTRRHKCGKSRGCFVTIDGLRPSVGQQHVRNLELIMCDRSLLVRITSTPSPSMLGSFISPGVTFPPQIAVDEMSIGCDPSVIGQVWYLLSSTVDIQRDGCAFSRGIQHEPGHCASEHTRVCRQVLCVCFSITLRHPDNLSCTNFAWLHRMHREDEMLRAHRIATYLPMYVLLHATPGRRRAPSQHWPD